MPEEALVGQESPSVQIPRFDLDTSLEDIMSATSAFNPFPYKATKGLQMWSTQLDTRAFIRYSATGEAYEVGLPIYRPMPNPRKPAAPLTRNPSSIGGNRHEGYINIEELWDSLSNQIVESQIRAQSKVYPLLEQAISPNKNDILTPEETYRNMIQMSLGLIAERDWVNAIILIESGPYSMVYPVGERKIRNPSEFPMLDYIQKVPNRSLLVHLFKAVALKRGADDETLTDEARRKLYIALNINKTLYEEIKAKTEPKDFISFKESYRDLGVEVDALEALLDNQELS